MGESSDWEWRVGALVGFGECAWQEKNGWVRRITIIAGMTPAAQLILSKCNVLKIIDGSQDPDGGDLEFEGKKLIALSSPCKPKNREDLDRLWSNSGIVLPGRGGPMPPMPPMPPGGPGQKPRLIV